MYGINEKEDVYPLRICQQELKQHFDLLLLSNDFGAHHYCYITNFSRLKRSQVTKHKQKSVFCKRCFKHYQGSKCESNLKSHLKDCLPNRPIRAVMPCGSDNDKEPPILKFSNFHFQHKLPITAYCDFEPILKRRDTEVSQYVSVKEIHEPMSFLCILQLTMIVYLRVL